MKYSIFLLFVIIAVSYISLQTDASSEDGYCKFGELKIKLNEWAPAPVGECMKCKCNSVKPERVNCVTCPSGKIRPEDEERCHFTEVDKSLQYPACCPKVVCK